MLETTILDSTYLFLAQADDAPGGGSLLWIYLGLFMAGMWFLTIAPQRKAQKAHDKMLTELKNGDEIMTKGGVFGTVVNVKADRLVLKIAENTKVEIAKPFIQVVVKKKGESEKTDAA
ncbi:preprotein translocase subunit YajC [Cerasicoccus arenae]|uniref:Sec translocon accessory complex subunit YajC n=1 Tax=Cerasicoccus arenae TaxID=424488 RepID=A0A8J3D8Y2_9BACT|nr:preprotein translocase subunit YajC [Cerasicoccus arenae]MBK1858304.1 preprotein translocase subunit YajC [Cerasicoccus arenae]GHB90649.1 hypothetical protein GCM10007047_01800 [Cerasicoccus arenae]